MSAERASAARGAHPPRSLLYVPASRPEMLAKIAGLSADAYVLDLEDGVPADGKLAALDAVAAWYRDAGSSAERAWVRVRSEADPGHETDVEALESCFPRGILLAKAERPEAAAALSERFGRSVRIGAMIETPRGVEAAGEIADVSDMLVLGSADLRAALGSTEDPGRTHERYALERVLYAARSAGAAAVDSVWFRFRDEDGLDRHGAIARNLGYDGKSCIHPSQIAPIHALWAPTDAETAWARSVIAAWERDDGDARGVVVSDGEMIEALHVRLAKRLLARAAAG